MIKARWWVLALAAHGAVLGAQTRSNDLSAPERAAGWRLLFDGRTLRGWRGLGYDTVPTAHWVVVDGAIKKIASGNVPKLPDGQPAQGGDLMTLDTFGDFELSWEWKVTPGANSGVKYNVSEELSMDTLYLRSEEHTSELQSRLHLVCRLLLEKKKRIGLEAKPML